MNKTIFGLFTFAVGGAIGFAAANKLLRERYEQRVQEEIDSVKSVFLSDRKREQEAREAKEEREEYASTVRELGYSDEEAEEEVSGPRVIAPEDVGEMPGYETISLTYYADGTLADDTDRAMSAEDIEETVGKESLSHFGEYEDDSVFVRNDRLKVDYEILSDPRTYAEILKEKPYLAR